MIKTALHSYACLTLDSNLRLRNILCSLYFALRLVVFVTDYMFIYRFFEAYEEQGVDFWGLSPLNEVIFGAEAGFQMPNIIMLPVQMRAWIRDYLGPMMADAGFGDVKIIALDDERSFMAWYAEAVRHTFEVLQSINRNSF